MTFSKRIFSVAAVMLVVTIAVALHGHYRVTQVRAGLNSVATGDLSTVATIERVGRDVLEQWVFLDQALRTIADTVDSERFNRLDGQIVALLNDAKATAPDHLAGSVDRLDVAYEDFASFAADMLLAHAVRDFDTVQFLLPGMRESFQAVQSETSALRLRAEDSAGDALDRAEAIAADSRTYGAVLILVGAVLGLGLAAMGMRSILDATRKLRHGTEQVGAGDLDTHVEVDADDEVGQVSTAFNAMVTELRHRERIRQTFGGYMDGRVVETLLDDPKIAMAGGRRLEVSVMMIRLIGLRAMSERLEASDLAKALDAYYQFMTDVVADHGGVVDGFVGDAVMAYWCEPFVSPADHAKQACSAAAEAGTHIDRLRGAVSIALDGTPAGIEFSIRIGVSTGDAVIGTMGSTASKRFTVVGDVIDIAALVVDANAAYGTTVLIDDRTRMQAGDGFRLRELDVVAALDATGERKLFDLLGLASDLAVESDDNDGADWVGRFESGLAAYRARKWDAAELAFRDCLVARPNDGPAQVFLDRVAHLRENPPGDGWPGTWPPTSA